MEDNEKKNLDGDVSKKITKIDRIQRSLNVLTVFIQTFAATIGVIFFFVWLSEAKVRKDVNTLREYDLDIKTAAILEQGRFGEKQSIYDKAVSFRMDRALLKKEGCFVDLSGLQLLNYTISSGSKCLIVGKHGEMISVAIINSHITFGAYMAPVVPDYAVSDLLVKNSTLELAENITISDSILLKPKFKQLRRFQVDGSYISNAKIFGGTVRLKHVYLKDSQLIVYSDDGAVSGLTGVVLDGTTITFVSACDVNNSCSEIIEHLMVIKNVCQINGGGISGYMIPQCRKIVKGKAQHEILSEKLTAVNLLEIGSSNKLINKISSYNEVDSALARLQLDKRYSYYGEYYWKLGEAELCNSKAITLSFSPKKNMVRVVSNERIPKFVLVDDLSNTIGYDLSVGRKIRQCMAWGMVKCEDDPFAVNDPYLSRDWDVLKKCSFIDGKPYFQRFDDLKKHESVLNPNKHDREYVLYSLDYPSNFTSEREQLLNSEGVGK